MKIHKWFNCDFEEWGITLKLRLYLNPFAFYTELEMFCFRTGFFLYIDEPAKA
jgi:hypothetical protein